MDWIVAKDRLRLMLDHFLLVGDPREACKVKYPLCEVLFLATCASIAGCDDYDEIADWGVEHLDFLRSYGEFFFGTPKEDWLRVVLNRIDPGLFEACFMAWAKASRPDTPDLIALDGKTVRRIGDAGRGLEPVHLVSAWASTRCLVLAQEAVEAKTNECTAILAILDRLSVEGALVTIDAIATNPTIAAATTNKGGDYILALKRNQPSLHDEVITYFDDLAITGLISVETVDKDHGRIETHTTTVSHDVAWMTGDRRHPGEHCFPNLACLIRATTQVEHYGKVTRDTRYFVASKALTPARAAQAIRSHWGIESLHWVLDVILKEDQSRLRRGHGATNMALVRRIAFNIVRAGKGKRSIKTTRKATAWKTEKLSALLNSAQR